jgi:hypothetical protein
MLYPLSYEGVVGWDHLVGVRGSGFPIGPIIRGGRWGFATQFPLGVVGGLGGWGSGVGKRNSWR